MQGAEKSLLLMSGHIRAIRRDLDSVRDQVEVSLEAVQSLAAHEGLMKTEADMKAFSQVRNSVREMLATHESFCMQSLGEAGNALDASRVSLIQLEHDLDLTHLEPLRPMVKQAYQQLDQACSDLLVIIQSCETLTAALEVF